MGNQQLEAFFQVFDAGKCAVSVAKHAGADTQSVDVNALEPPGICFTISHRIEVIQGLAQRADQPPADLLAEFGSGHDHELV